MWNGEECGSSGNWWCFSCYILSFDGYGTLGRQQIIDDSGGCYFPATYIFRDTNFVQVVNPAASHRLTLQEYRDQEEKQLFSLHFHAC